MPKYIINFLIKICLINIFTIKIFSQNCCDECFKNCKKILCKKNDNNSDLDDNSDFDNNLDLNNKNDNSNLNNNLDLDDNSDLDNNQEEYFKSLLEDFDKNIKNFNNSIFSENLDSTEAEYTIVTDGTTNNNGILGQGSYGTVYKVKNKKVKYFALKKVFIDERYEFSTKKEIQILVKCRDCKNVIKIVDVYKDTCKYFWNSVYGYFYYIITEIYEGGDLKSFIDKCKSLSPGLEYKEIIKKKEKYIYQMINAVKQIHEKGIKHRDIKPANFFIGENDKLYLGDFGTATENYDGLYIIGTPFYMYYFLNFVINLKNGDQNVFSPLFKHCDLYSLMCNIFELINLFSFADYNEIYNVNYEMLFHKPKPYWVPATDFAFPDDLAKIVMFEQKEQFQNIKNNYFFQRQVEACMQQINFNMFSFSPILRWSNYLLRKNININSDIYAYMLNEIIQNLFITTFDINSVTGTPCYKNLDNEYKNQY